ncbi:carbohydrate-binding protein SusD [Pseudalgibacter alginicilyticus]|uniref:Carbohydrate-binding protein SusD n=1 Tax=Pseudalgibacter alginicilyticus TaxID=1736674 RepID=A0A0N7HYX8_9FLAO|nr:RagB/SusD family nutrient uptake outer membrane protein [Pseudalgibacter alginicilyticus]ALJ06494.1 carbohydrate-binding protein SusD [Pseudalgibacter alginicilyticus]
MNKNIKTILLGLTFLILTVSCSNDWLDEQSSTQLSASEQFESVDGFKDALMGVYLGLTEPELYAKDMNWNLVDVLSQQYSTFSFSADYAGIQLFNYETANAVDQIEGLWSHAYNVIANINIALEMMETNRDVLTDIDYAIIKGELLGLRAYVHFDIMRLFATGNLEDRPSLLSEKTIPYVTQFSKNITAQLSYSETLALMEEDLETALELLNEDPIYATNKPADYYDDVNRTGFYDQREQRMNYYAVKALQARVFQWEGKQTEAAIAAEVVIANAFTSLINSATYPVSTDKIFYQEVLFALDIDNFTDLVNDLLVAEGDGSNYNALYYTTNFTDDTFETSNLNIGIVDVRYNTLMETQSQGVVNTKLIQGGSASDSYNQMPLIKLPEMYYIAAEAYAKEGTSAQLGNAIDYLNLVRTSRGIIEVIPDTATQEEVMLEIKKEYKKEFLSEGQLFFYYKRTGETEIFGLSDSVILDDAVYVLPFPDVELEFGSVQ